MTVQAVGVTPLHAHGAAPLRSRIAQQGRGRFVSAARGARLNRATCMRAPGRCRSVSNIARSLWPASLAGQVPPTSGGSAIAVCCASAIGALHGGPFHACVMVPTLSGSHCAETLARTADDVVGDRHGKRGGAL